MKIKGFDKDLRCRGFQFQVGETYDTGAKELRLCSDTVFHYCNSIQQVHAYYQCGKANRFCEIEVLGEEVTDGEKCGSNRIRIVREIVGDELNALIGRIDGNTGLFNTGNRNTGNRNTGSHNTGDHNTGDRNTGDHNTGNHNTGHCNAGYYNTGHCNAGSRNSGSYNAGIFNSCDYSSGIFCSKPEHIRIFNCDSGMTAEEFYESKYYEALMSSPFVLTEWVEYTEEEKDTDAKRSVGGYLKKRTYKEACANWWANMADENRSIIMSMPNFDSDVFFDITGIKV